MPTLIQYLQTFILSGLTVTGIQYLGNSANPLLGGILSGIPISIPSMLLISSLSKQKQFIFSANIMVALLAIVTCLCWYLFTKLNWSSYHAVLLSTGLWLCCALLYFYFVVKK